MTLPRRTLLTRIAAALSAPVVALGAGRRKVKRRMGSAKGRMWMAADFDAPWTAEDAAQRREAARRHEEAVSALMARAEAAEADWQTAESSLREARGLLAEAREELARWYDRELITFKRKDGSTWDYIVPLPRDDGFLVRIDSHLGRGAGWEG